MEGIRDYLSQLERLRELVDVEVHVESEWIEQVEDVHLILEHLITCVVRDLAQAGEGGPGDGGGNGMGSL